MKKLSGFFLVAIVAVSTMSFLSGNVRAINRGTILVSEEYTQSEYSFDSPYFEGFKSLLISQGYSVIVSKSVITQNLLSDVDVLIVHLPTAQYSSSEIDEIEKFVAKGGGLFCIADHTTAWRVDDIIARWGFYQASGYVTDSNNYVGGHDFWVYYEKSRGNFATHPITTDLNKVQSACSNWFLSALPNYAVSIITTDTDGTASPGGVSIYAALDLGTGRIVISMDSDYFGYSGYPEIGLNVADNARLGLNTIAWLTGQNIIDNEPPVIQNVRHEPLYPLFGDEIFFYADVTDNVAVDKVQLNYTLDGGATWLLKDMSLLEGHTYSTSLGPYDQFKIIGFYVIAYDTSGNMAWGSEIMPPLPEPPRAAPVVVSDENPAPLPNGQDIWYDTTDTLTTIYVDLWELGLYLPGVQYYIWYSIDSGLTWIKEELTYISEYARKFDIPSLTNILFRIETSDGKSSKVYWIIIGPWKYPIYLYFSASHAPLFTEERYYPVKGLDFDSDNDITNNKDSYDYNPASYELEDLDQDGTLDVPAYTFTNPKTLDDGCLVIEYWLYYAFNDYMFLDKHEHDFESIFIWIDIATGNLKKIALSQHTWVNHYLLNVPPTRRINVAVELGGHGMQLLADLNEDGLPDESPLGNYLLAAPLEPAALLPPPLGYQGSPPFWGWICPGSLVARIYPWTIFDTRKPQNELHLFGDSNILTAGLPTFFPFPHLIQDPTTGNIDQGATEDLYNYFISLIGKNTLLKTKYAFEISISKDFDLTLAFMVTAPWHREEFMEPKWEWLKASYGLWIAKKEIGIAVDIITGGLIGAIKTAVVRGILTPLALQVVTKIISWLVDPVSCSIIDQSGNILGYRDHNIVSEITGSHVLMIRNMTYNMHDLFLILTNQTEGLTYEVMGTELISTYNFTVTCTYHNGFALDFKVMDIPTHLGEIHRYLINWTMLEHGEQGVDVLVDKNGDGIFEHRFNSDSTLTRDEFQEATADDIPPTTNLEIGEPKFTDAIKGVYVSSSTPLTLIAEDNPGGTGVASTFYHIYNSTYDKGWLEYTLPFYLTGLSDCEYSIDYYSVDKIGNKEATKTATLILDNSPPSTTLTIGEPKYISDTTYVTPDTPFTLEATDTGSGVYSIAYRIYNGAYDSGWITYTEPFHLTALADGTYTIEYYSIDNLGNVEATKSIKVTLFSWGYVFTDSHGRGTILKINLAHKLIQFTTPDKDYGIRKATYMRQCGRAIIIKHCDNKLRLITIAVDIKLDFCVAIAWDKQTNKQYFLIDKAGIER